VLDDIAAECRGEDVLKPTIGEDLDETCKKAHSILGLVMA